MLKTANDLSAYTLAAGEPFFLEVQLQDSTGAVLDLTERAFVLSFYKEDRSTAEAIDGEQLVDATGRFLRFARDGRFSESLYGQNLTIELAERYLNGRAVVTQGRLTVERSAAGVLSFGNGIVSKFVTRITIKDNAVLGGPPAFTQQQLIYRPDATTPPVTLGVLSLSATLRAGTASSGLILGATSGSTISESIVGLSIDSAERTYAWDGTGGAGTYAGGMVESHSNATNSGRASPVTIAAALPTIYFASATVSASEGNSGTKDVLLTAKRSTTVGAVAATANFVQGSAGPADFAGNALPGNKTFTFADGSDTATQVVVVSGDTDIESNETFGYQLVAPNGYTLGSPSSVTGTILNDDTGASPATFAMTQLASPYAVFPRTATTGGGAGKGVGTIPVTLNVTQAGTIYARTRSAASGNPILQASYLAIANAPVANGSVNIPNVDVWDDDYYLDLSPDGTTWTNGTTPVAVGAHMGFGGQSLQYNNLVRATGTDTLANVGETPTGKGSVYFDGAWRRVVEATNTAGNVVNGAGMNVLVRLHAERLGCRVGLVGHAISATSIDIWVPGGTGGDSRGWDGLSAAINATGKRLEVLISTES